MALKKGTMMNTDELDDTHLDAADWLLAAPGLDEHVALLATLLVGDDEVEGEP